jgi:hypothetical protein
VTSAEELRELEFRRSFGLLVEAEKGLPRQTYHNEPSTLYTFTVPYLYISRGFTFNAINWFMEKV